MSLARRKTRKVIVGDKLHGFVGIGGDAPVALQTMTSTYTYDIDITVKQINALHRGGADMVRVAVPSATPPRHERQRERDKAPPPAAAEAQGYLTLAADPFGTVYIDGVEIGVTPLFSYGVKPGRHAIRVERAGYRTQNETVQVDAGNTVTKRYTLIQEQP